MNEETKAIKVENLSTDEQILIELRTIREQLVPKEEPEEEPIKKRKLKGFYNEFIEFLKKYKVFGLAVAFIMALYLGGLVQALVSDIILPILLYIPGLNQLGKIEDWSAGNFLIGHFLIALITFIIVAFVIFAIVKIATKIGLEE